MALRSPIVAVLGHVDHGKSSLLDAIRGSNIVATEAGKITQAIGASIVPLDTIRTRAGPLLKALKINLTLPGLLFIDTPGHEAFTTLRKRGGSLADIAVVVVDISEGFKPQTIEAIEILRAAKTPFIVAANKMDLIPGYRQRAQGVLSDIQQQDPPWQTAFETKLYDLVGKLHERFGMNADRFDRIDDFTKQVALVPTSATTGQGVNELLVMLAGLAQRFLEQHLRLNVDGPGRGTVLEVKETTGFGTTIDVILYDGVIRKNDAIAIAGVDTPIVTKVRAILEPAPLQEMRDRKSRYAHQEQAVAATGLKIAAPGLEQATAGMPLRVIPRDADAGSVTSELQAEVAEVMVTTDKEGVILKADTLGSLEALSFLLRGKGIPIRKASVGQISKKDLADVEANYDTNPLHAVLLGFNIQPVGSTERARVITSSVIYELLDKLEAWRTEVQNREKAAQLDALVRPSKLTVLQNCVFRQSNPCVLGIEVLGGTLTTGTPLMDKTGRRISTVKAIQRSKENLSEARFGEQVAVSLPDIIAGRHVHENDVLYSAITEEQFRQLKNLAKLLSEQERNIMKEIAEIMRKGNPLWGV